MIECQCGMEIDTTYEFGPTIVCDCGRMYNPFGQQVVGRLEDIDPAYAGEEW